MILGVLIAVFDAFVHDGRSWLASLYVRYFGGIGFTLVGILDLVLNQVLTPGVIVDMLLPHIVLLIICSY